MLQRKQTLFLLAALILTIICLCLPIGKSHAEDECGMLMYNLYVIHANERVMSLWPLFLVMLLSAVLNLTTIISFKNRKKQINLCAVCIFLQIAWYVIYSVYYHSVEAQFPTINCSPVAALPLVNIILYILARKGVIHDEKLVRAVDRIR